jgi:hypothetical protein
MYWILTYEAAYHTGRAAVHAGNVGDNAVDLLLVVGAEQAADPAAALPLLLLLHVGHALAPPLAVSRLAADVHLGACKQIHTKKVLNIVLC